MDKQIKDHRQIGQELDLFFVHEYAPGATFWLPKGWIIYQQLVDFIKDRIKNEEYQEISTPVMIKSALFKKSGHWEHFGEHNMFNLAIYEKEELSAIFEALSRDDKVMKRIREKQEPFTAEINYELNGTKQKAEVGIDNIRYEGTNVFFRAYPLVNYSLKPMNCPEAALVFAHKTRSYKDLPLRLSEFGILHRRELSGVIGGLLRTRQFVIDDAHLFVREDQIMGEIHKLLVLVMDLYKSLGFEPKFYLATRPDKAMGDIDKWKVAEKDLKKALEYAKVNYEVKEKDGAFYGPKIDTHIKDSQGRDWQLATIQLDFMIPEGLELEYIDSKGKKVRPVMIHRGIFGSVERFIGMLVEHFQGKFPLWLSPVQVVIVPIADRNVEYAQSVHDELITHHIRCELDDRSETMQAKIRDATLQKVPYQVIIGDREIKKNLISVRIRAGDDLGPMSITDFIKKLEKEIDQKV